jgi:hypothetical protein
MYLTAECQPTAIKKYFFFFFLQVEEEEKAVQFNEPKN